MSLWWQFDPNQPAIVYASVFGSLYKSLDAGTTWSQLLTAPGGVASLTIAPSKPTIVYEGTFGGMFVTRDRGATWSPAGLAGTLVASIAVDPTTPAVVYGATAANPAGFVSKISPTGSLIYSTYLGGAGFNYARAIAVGTGGNAYVTGTASTPDFPTTPGAFQPATGAVRSNAFVSKISGQTMPCSFSVSPGSYFLYAGGGTADFSVVSPTGCAWNPTPSASWITVTSGSGPGVAR
jgi:hypothetical protein